MAVSQPSQRTIDGPAGRLFVDDGGAGGRLPVVLIHSLAGNTEQWAPQLAHLRRSGRAVAFDLRGHGRSEAPRDSRFAPGDYAGDARAVMDSLNISRAVLVGHSLGGGVAVAFTGQWPDRVAGLFLVDPIDDASKRPVDGNFAAFLTQLEGPDYEATITGYWSSILAGANDAVRAQVLADLRATPQRTMVGSMRAMPGLDARAALVPYRGRMLTLTTPMNDFPSSLHKVVDHLPHETMDEVSHWLHLDRPTEFNARLDRFLADLGR